MTPRNPVLALALTAVLAGCAVHPPAQEHARTTTLPDSYNTMTSRFVVIPAYELQGVNATRTTNWYYGAGQGLDRYVFGGTAYDEAYWQQRYASMPDDYKDAMNSVPLARFHFEFDSTKLTPTSQREMSSFLEGEDLAGRILVVGYTDHLGTESYNIPLSQRRADAIAGQLDVAWPNARLLTEGHGIYPKLIDDTTDEARAANRRAEIFYLEADQ